MRSKAYTKEAIFPIIIVAFNIAAGKKIYKYIKIKQKSISVPR